MGFDADKQNCPCGSSLGLIWCVSGVKGFLSSIIVLALRLQCIGAIGPYYTRSCLQICFHYSQEII